MRKNIYNRIHSPNRRRQSRFSSLTLLLVMVSLLLPVTVSCQRAQGSPDRGLEELGALVARSAGKPSPEELIRIEKKFSGTRAASLAAFLRGYLYYSSRDYAEAAGAFDERAIAEKSSLGDYALFYRAESNANAGATSRARSDYETLYTNYPNSLLAREARLKAAETAIALGDPGSATRELAQMIQSNDADALYIQAQAHEIKQERDQAIAIYRRVCYERPATSARVRAEARLKELGAAIENNPGSLEEELSRADALFESNQYGDAADAYAALLERFPDAERMDEIQFRMGVGLVKARKPAQAVLPLTRVSSRNADLQAEALYYQADALRSSNRASESAVIVDRLLNQHAKSRWAEEGLYDLANYLDKRDRKSEAASRYRQLLAAYPKGRHAPTASYQLGWQAYQAKNYREAARMLEQHLANYRYPDTKFIGEAAFWAAKSEERLGNRERALALYDLARERYRYGYHGYVAGLRADRLRAADSRLRPEQPEPGSDLERMRRNALHVENIRETADGSETERIARADDFEMIGLTDLLVKELNRALEGAPDSPRINLRLAQHYSRQGEKFQATLVLRRGYPDIYSYDDADLPREAWEIFFPLIEWNTIKEEAKRYGIDPHIAAGLIRQESVFNPGATSRVGARGLMQLMPDTGRLVARRQGTGQITTDDLYNPVLNIKLGMNYLAQMMGQFGRIEYAAAAYNAGPGRAKRWIAERGSLDIEDWIETIPFTETRGYVQGVLRYAANYRRFYK